MLSQNHKTIINTLTFAVLGVTTLGGVVNAQEYRFPPADTSEIFQPKAKSTPAVSQVTKPALNRQPVRQTQAYPAQRPAPYGAPRAPFYGSAPYRGPVSRSMPAPMRSAPGAPPPYAVPYNNRPAYGNPSSNRPYNAGPYNNPYNRGPKPYNLGANPYNRAPNPYNSGRPYNNPYNRGPNNNNGPFGGGGGPFKNFGGGPFNGNSAPWETWPFGGRDSFWSRKEFPFNEQNPGDWFDPADPKEGMAIMWDDLIAAPDDLGTMPGGWTVPSISTPNPVDLEDQLEEASKEVPDLIRIYSD